jgi:hypothetical protein
MCVICLVCLNALQVASTNYQRTVTAIYLVFAVSSFISHPFLTSGKLIGKKGPEHKTGSNPGGSLQTSGFVAWFNFGKRG